MSEASSIAKVTEPADGVQGVGLPVWFPVDLDIEVHVVAEDEQVAGLQRAEAEERERLRWWRRRVPWMRKVGLLPRSRTLATPTRGARPREAGHPPTRRSTRSGSRGGDSGDSDGEPPPALAGPSPRFSRSSHPIPEARVTASVARACEAQLDLGQRGRP